MPKRHRPGVAMTKRLAQLIHEAVYKRFMSYKRTVFLCGAGKHQKTSIRKALDRELSSSRYWFRYDIFYPEDLFDELLFGTKHRDLISLENMLASSVDAVVLVVESAGTIAELGAFAANPRLRKKLVAVIDRRRRRDKSFISYGPLRLLREKKGAIVYGDFSDVASMVPEIQAAIDRAHRNYPKRASVRSVVQAHHYVLSSVYLLEPVPRATLVDLVYYASKGSKPDAEALTAAALSVLSKHREVELTPDGYSLTRSGLASFHRVGTRGMTRIAPDRRVMDGIRVQVLNWKLRGKMPVSV